MVYFHFLGGGEFFSGVLPAPLATCLEKTFNMGSRGNLPWKFCNWQKSWRELCTEKHFLPWNEHLLCSGEGGYCHLLRPHPHMPILWIYPLILNTERMRKCIYNVHFNWKKCSQCFNAARQRCWNALISDTKTILLFPFVNWKLKRNELYKVNVSFWAY